MTRSSPDRMPKRRNRIAAGGKPAASPAPAPGTPGSFLIVGIGASAGALEAYTRLLKALPADSGMAFVLVPHLDPFHESSLGGLLSHTTAMPVLQAEDGMKVEPNHVYVLPANWDMTIARGVLRLKRRLPGRGPHMVVDSFLRSLADDQGNKAVGVILSGTASDGTLGVAAVKSRGGVTFAQDPESARYSGMPGSAVDSGCVDFVQPPEGIARELLRLHLHPHAAQPQKENKGEAQRGERPAQFARVLQFLHESGCSDFSGFSPEAIRGRILRRMAHKQIQELGDYVRYLQRHPEEVRALNRHLSAGISRFFRDPAAYAALRNVGYPALLQDRPGDQPIRIWVPGCSSGEEFYSQVISLVEYLEQTHSRISVKAFGTDLSAEAIQVAGQGVYDESISKDVSPEHLRRFFTPLNGGYQIDKGVRGMCVFGVQNILKDPPLFRMDIVSCRNLLAQLRPGLQKEIIPIFHYALKPGGFLMGSEVDVGTGLFEPVDQEHNLYRKRHVPSPVRFSYTSNYQEPPLRRVEPLPASTMRAATLLFPLDLQRDVDRILLARYAPTAVVVNDQLEILQTRGHTHRYLELPAGKASLNLLNMARHGLVSPLFTLLKEARTTGSVARTDGLQFDSDQVNIEVIPVKSQQNKNWNFIVRFENPLRNAAPAPPPGLAARRRVSGSQATRKPGAGQSAELEHELAATREYLQSVIDEQAANNEQAQSTNEELQSTNEELQSTNEELHTSKEELESANEELNSVNDQVHEWNQALTEMTSDLTNFLTSAKIPMVMLGHDLSLRRFTPQAESAFGFQASNTGQPITRLRLQVEVPDLESKLHKVIQEGATVQQEIQDRTGAWHMLRISPYFAADHRVEGAVMSLQDIDELKRSNEELALERHNLAAERGKLEEVLRQMPCGLVIAEAPSGRLLRANSSLRTILGHTFSPGENLLDYARHALFHANGNPQGEEKWAIARSLAGETVSDEEMEWIRPDGKHVFVAVSSAPIRTREGAISGVVATFFDLTFRHSAEEMLRSSEQMAATGRLAAALAHEINNPLEVITNTVYLLSQEETLSSRANEYMSIAEAELKRISHISHSLLGLYRRKPVSEAFHVQEVLDEVLELFEAKSAGKKIQVVKRYECDGELHGSSTEVRQIFLNLVGNAIEAVGEDATITLRIIPSCDWKSPWSRGIRVAVADNGPGIARENRASVFEPFFTTKGERGTGLGLWVSRGIIDKYGGDIRFRSSTVAGKSGTLFSVFFPSRVARRCRKCLSTEKAKSMSAVEQGASEAAGS